MNWYKTSQQMLMFYPWGDDAARNVLQRVSPSRRDEKGNEYYKCSVCGKEIQEPEIADWVRSENTSQYLYPTYDINPEDVKSGLKQVATMLSKYTEQIKENTDYRYELPVPDIQNFLQKNPQITKYIQFLERTGTSNAHYHNKDLFILMNVLDTGQLHTAYSDEINHFLTNINTIIEEVDYNFSHYKQFQVSQEVPVCRECLENFPKCYSCDDIITNKDEIAYTKGGEPVCQNCLDRGIMDICNQCGYALFSDETRNSERFGTLCEDCAEELEEDYEDNFAEDIENLGAGNTRPFNAWLDGKERIFIPFEPHPEMSNNDYYVINILKDNGWDTTPEAYRNGIAFQDYTTNTGQTKKRNIKIGRLLQMLRDKSIKAEKKPNRREEISSMYNYALEIFNKSEARKARKSSNLMIAISQNPHDMAKMTTGRDWTSCMRLTNRPEDVYCEVEEGGIIAYLVKQGDEEIEKPLARVLIRRYENKEKKSVAKVENDYYGNAPSGFVDAVDN